MPDRFVPNIVGFLCNWCSYGGADRAGSSKLDVPPSISVVRVMCSSRVDTSMVLNALLWGADGVLVAGCHPGDCHYKEGNYFTRRRFAQLKKVLESLGLEPERVELAWVSASEGQRYADVVNDFTDKVTQIGPNPLKETPY
ncbi:methyl-viologen-reducing hydrogenase subunit delta [bacterium]|nr:MAG: methyl-viologen-reducing hydrogenase subunit delta [bacterium]